MTDSTNDPDRKTTNREAIYDEHISPLMTKIIALCKAHDIPMLASFDLDDNRDDPERRGLACTTMILPKNAAERFHAAAREIENKPMFAAFTIITEPRK